jgi:hypothetical protein
LLLLREGGGSYKPKAGKDRKEKKKGADSLWWGYNIDKFLALSYF